MKIWLYQGLKAVTLRTCRAAVWCSVKNILAAELQGVFGEFPASEKYSFKNQGENNKIKILGYLSVYFIFTYKYKYIYFIKWAVYANISYYSDAMPGKCYRMWCEMLMLIRYLLTRIPFMVIRDLSPVYLCDFHQLHWTFRALISRQDASVSPVCALNWGLGSFLEGCYHTSNPC